jgi:hypothetical protein
LRFEHDDRRTSSPHLTDVLTRSKRERRTKFNLYHHQHAVNHDKPTIRPPPSRNLRPSAASSQLLARFAQLPTTVQSMMEQQGVLPPTELRTSAAFMSFLEQTLDPVTLKVLSDPQQDLLEGLSAVQRHLKARSAEALALHLYTKELLRLISVAAARQHLAVARNR